MMAPLLALPQQVAGSCPEIVLNCKGVPVPPFPAAQQEEDNSNVERHIQGAVHNVECCGPRLLPAPQLQPFLHPCWKNMSSCSSQRLQSPAVPLVAQLAKQHHDSWCRVLLPANSSAATNP